MKSKTTMSVQYCILTRISKLKKKPKKAVSNVGEDKEQLEFSGVGRSLTGYNRVGKLFGGGHTGPWCCHCPDVHRAHFLLPASLDQLQLGSRLPAGPGSLAHTKFE